MEREPLIEFQPIAVPGQFWVQGPVIAGMIAIIPAFLGFVLTNMVMQPVGPPDVIVGVIFYVISFVGILGLVWLKAFVEPERSRYTIYEDSIEYESGLWNRSRRTIAINHVVDVQLTEGIFQQRVQAGTVTLLIQQMQIDDHGAVSPLRFTLQNIPHPQEIYELLRSLALKP